MLEHPSGTSGRAIETSRNAVAGVFDTILKEEVDSGYDTCHVNTGVVADASTVTGWSLEGWEALLGDFAAADSEVAIAFSGREDVDVVIRVIVLVAKLEA